MYLQYGVCVDSCLVCAFTTLDYSAVTCSVPGEPWGSRRSILNPKQTCLATALLCGALVRLELDELLGHIIVVALGEDAQDSEARLIHVDAFTQRQPAGGAALRDHVLQLKDRHAHGSVLTGEAVVFHTHLQLIALRTHLVAQCAVEELELVI